ncbi:MAG TPA: hypothetical protein VJK51_02325 [Candidatus Nanoarchaeia archaeon]|nr:hypothetical protein [Candidatus Nanoarchaeia archaeon]
MVNITLSVNEELKKKMEKFQEINWSGLIRKTLEEKARLLELKEKMLVQIKEEEEFTNWTIDMGRKVKKGMAERLKKEGYIK